MRSALAATASGWRRLVATTTTLVGPRPALEHTLRPSDPTHSPPGALCPAMLATEWIHANALRVYRGEEPLLTEMERSMLKPNVTDDDFISVDCVSGCPRFCAALSSSLPLSMSEDKQ